MGQTNELSHLMGALMRSRKHVSDSLTVQQFIVLLAVFEGGEAGVQQGALISRCDVGRSNVSKIVAALGALGKSKKPGPGLIRTRPDESDLRTRMHYCTAEGVAAVRKVLRLPTGTTEAL